MTSLQKLTITFNYNLSGTIPMELCGLKKLRSLHLQNNQLTGPIPPCFSDDMGNLQLLDLTNNQLNSNIPETMCQIPLMNELLLGLNNFTGAIPPCLGAMPSVTHLVLHGNQLEGNLPTLFCQMPNVLNLDFSQNLLDGPIPPCFGMILLLQGLDLSDNFFTGTVPTELGGLSNTLRILSLNDNELNGDPSNVFNELTRLRVLLAANNNFTFTMNSSFVMNTISLKHLDVSGNRNIGGTFPEHLLSYASLVSVDVSTNQLTGKFPVVIDANVALEVLAVNNNVMSGPVTSLVSLSQLSHLDLSNNQFTGAIDSLGALDQLQNLFVSENPFNSAPIPTSFGALVKLEALSLRSTNRTEELFEPNLDNWISMKFLDFGSNNLVGTIPETYGKLPFLQYLILNDNKFLNGDLPSTFEFSTELIGIFLDGTSIAPQTSIDVLCTLPNFSNGLNVEEVFIVDCQGTCSDECAGCLCCDADRAMCSNSYLNEFDNILDEVYRRTSNFYAVTEIVESTYEDHIRN